MIKCARTSHCEWPVGGEGLKGDEKESKETEKPNGN